MLQRTPPGIDLSTFSLPAAFGLAVSMSGKPDWEIAAGMSWSQSVASRVLNPGDDYWPTLPSLPQLCRVLGNTVLVDWLSAQSETGVCTKPALPGMDVPALLQRLRRILAETADVTATVGDVVSDGALDEKDARALLRELEHLVAAAAPAISGAREIIDTGKRKARS